MVMIVRLGGLIVQLDSFTIGSELVVSVGCGCSMVGDEEEKENVDTSSANRVCR